MAASYTVLSDNHGLKYNDPDVDIFLSVDFDVLDGTSGIDLTADEVNAALLAAGHPDFETIDEIKSVVCSPSADGSVIAVYDAENEKLIPMTRSAAQAWATLAVTSHESAAHAAGLQVAAVELAAGGVTGPGNITSAAPSATKDVKYDPATRKFTFLAADAVTSCKVLGKTGELASFPSGTDLGDKPVTVHIRASRP